MSSTLFLVSLDNTEAHVITELVDSVHKLRGSADVSVFPMHAQCSCDGASYRGYYLS